jgi:hypothetical protein
MTLIRYPWLAKSLSRNEINLHNARMELRDPRQIHAERPHCFQRGVDDHFLP